MPPPLFIIRSEQLGITMADIEKMKIGKKNNMNSESQNDDYKYAELATQEDFDRF